MTIRILFVALTLWAIAPHQAQAGVIRTGAKVVKHVVKGAVKVLW